MKERKQTCLTTGPSSPSTKELHALYIFVLWFTQQYQQSSKCVRKRKKDRDRWRERERERERERKIVWNNVKNVPKLLIIFGVNPFCCCCCCCDPLYAFFRSSSDDWKSQFWGEQQKEEEVVTLEEAFVRRLQLPSYHWTLSVGRDAQFGRKWDRSFNVAQYFF